MLLPAFQSVKVYQKTGVEKISINKFLSPVILKKVKKGKKFWTKEEKEAVGAGFLNKLCNSFEEDNFPLRHSATTFTQLLRSLKM